MSKVVSRTIKEGVRNPTPIARPLTHRELEILHLLAEDETLQGISVRLGISYATVRTMFNTC